MTKNMLIAVGTITALIILVAGVRVGLLIRSLSTYKTYWQKEAVKKPVPGSLIYIALGDSTAQGIGASSAGQGYVGLVEKHLEQKTGKPVHVINISVSGAKISDAIKNQLPRLKNFPRADYVTIEIGANDVPVYDRNTFKREFSQLLKLLPDQTVVANMPSFRGGRMGKLDDNAVDASKVIAELLAGYPNMRLADVYQATRQQNIRDFGADLYHPSNSGYQNWAQAFVRAIDTTQ